eukprot:626585-Pleurochrysis_carterae.AAC.1
MREDAMHPGLAAAGLQSCVVVLRPRDSDCGGAAAAVMLFMCCLDCGGGAPPYQVWYGNDSSIEDVNQDI